MVNFPLILGLIKVTLAVVILLLVYQSVYLYKLNRILFSITVSIIILLLISIFLLHDLDITAFNKILDKNDLTKEIIRLKTSVDNLIVSAEVSTTEISAQASALSNETKALPDSFKRYYKLASTVLPLLSCITPVWSLTSSSIIFPTTFLLFPSCFVGELPYYLLKIYFTGTIIETVGNTAIVAEEISNNSLSTRSILLLGGSLALTFLPKLLDLAFSSYGYF